jgi:hypothetical protein
MEVECYSEMMISALKSTQCHNAEEQWQHMNCNLNSPSLIMSRTLLSTRLGMYSVEYTKFQNAFFTHMMGIIGN